MSVKNDRRRLEKIQEPHQEEAKESLDKYCPKRMQKAEDQEKVSTYFFRKRTKKRACEEERELEE